jgi:hypothetical protein
MSDMDGWIKLHRKFINWEWFDNNNMVKLFIYLLLNCNHQDNNWHGINIKRGQFLTSIDKLSKNLKLTNQQTRTLIGKLKMSGELTSETTNQFTILTLVNYNTYQDEKTKINKQNNDKITNEQQTTNKQTNNKQEDKKEKNDKNKINSSLFLNENFVKIWEEWITFRKEMKKPLTETTIKKQIKHLEQFEVHNSILMIEQSIQNGWLGIFELKKDYKKDTIKADYSLMDNKALQQYYEKLRQQNEPERFEALLEINRRKSGSR